MRYRLRPITVDAADRAELQIGTALVERDPARGAIRGMSGDTRSNTARRVRTVRHPIGQRIQVSGCGRPQLGAVMIDQRIRILRVGTVDILPPGSRDLVGAVGQKDSDMRFGVVGVILGVRVLGQVVDTIIGQGRGPRGLVVALTGAQRGSRCQGRSESG